MKYSFETTKYLVQRFNALNDNADFHAAYERMSKFADTDATPMREELLQYAIDLDTVAAIIRSVIKDCDEVQGELEISRYVANLPPSVKERMEEIGKRVQVLLEARLKNDMIKAATLANIRHIVENELNKELSSGPLMQEDIDFLRKRIFDNLLINGVPFEEVEKNPNHPLLGRSPVTPR